MKRSILPFLACLLLLISCNNSDDNKKPGDNKKDTAGLKKEVKATKAEPSSKKAPIINIVDTIAPRRIIVYLKDSAASFERISIKLARAYGVRLAECFKKNGLKSTGQPMAWYLTRKAPYFFEAGIPVNKRPVKLIAGVMVREMSPDSAVIAHFYGPYDLMHVGYEALEEWLKDHHKTAAGSPFEIYIGDPIDKKGKPLDPYRVQTDIVFLHK